MLPKRFSIRTTLAVVFVVAVACRFAPTLYRRAKFARQYNALRENDWRRSHGTADGYEFRAANGVLLSAWTTEQQYNRKTGSVEPLNYTPDPTRFYVIPPGKWVDTLDEVLEAWDEHD